MSTEKTIIKNGNIVLENEVIKGDLVIENGRITAMQSAVEVESNCRVIEADGMMVMPGMIDTHVHLQDPGPYDYREDWYHGTCAAAAGGITTVADMPLPSVAVLDKERFDLKLETASKNSVVDFLLWGGITPKNMDKLEELNDCGCVGYKGFMSFATEEYPQITDGHLVDGMRKVAGFDGLIAVHAENAEAADFGCKRFSAEKCEDEAKLDDARPWWVEYEAIHRAALFARQQDTRLMVCHTTIVQGAEYLKRIKAEGAKIFVESCPHYLIFDRNILREKKAFAKCTPPFRNRENVDRLWDYVFDGTIDVMGSDHGPFTDEEKGKEGDFWKEYCGFGCNDAVLSALITEGVHKRGLSWSRLASLTSGNAARMFQIYPQKGSLLPGSDADIILVDPNAEWVYDGTKSFSKTKSAKGVYQDMRFKGKVVSTMVRGNMIFSEGKIIGCAGSGSFVNKNAK